MPEHPAHARATTPPTTTPPPTPTPTPAPAPALRSEISDLKFSPSPSPSPSPSSSPAPSPTPPLLPTIPARLLTFHLAALEVLLTLAHRALARDDPKEARLAATALARSTAIARLLPPAPLPPRPSPQDNPDPDPDPETLPDWPGYPPDDGVGPQHPNDPAFDPEDPRNGLPQSPEELAEHQARAREQRELEEHQERERRPGLHHPEPEAEHDFEHPPGSARNLPYGQGMWCAPYNDPRWRNPEQIRAEQVKRKKEWLKRQEKNRWRKRR